VITNPPKFDNKPPVTLMYILTVSQMYLNCSVISVEDTWCADGARIAIACTYTICPVTAPDVLHASVKRDPTKFSNSRNAGPTRLFLATAPRSDV
jgi:hypothetical protein